MSWAELLETDGWRREIAGETDFNAAVAAFQSAQIQHKGVIIAGECGCGKTALLKAAFKRRTGFYLVELGLTDDLERLQPWYWDYFGKNPFELDVVLDDLGAETTENDFGVYSELVADFIMMFYERAEPNCRLFVTTNLNESGINERYGGRILSRLKTLCVPLHLTGRDKRVWTIPQTKKIMDK